MVGRSPRPRIFTLHFSLDGQFRTISRILPSPWRREICPIPSLSLADSQLENIPEPDWLPLDDLVGYDHEKETLVQNTQCLLAGLPALNVLLYGSRGSGNLLW